MTKPLLLIVTGRPGSGKTTLSHLLHQELKCPLISRDELKEGYIHTLGVPHQQLGDSAAWHIYETFFETIDLLISKNISIVVEAAFQDNLWKRKLPSLANRSTIKVIRCKVSVDTARQRFEHRLTTNPERKKFHGDSHFAEDYEPLNMDVPTLEVDTTLDYNPALAEITRFAGPPGIGLDQEK